MTRSPRPFGAYTVDETARARAPERRRVSIVVNTALAERLDRLTRHAALGNLVEHRDSLLGPIDERERLDIRASFAEAHGGLDQRGTA